MQPQRPNAGAQERNHGEPSDRTRVLAVVRWPVGGIRTYMLYNYPALLRAGYRFTFVGPDNDDFRDFAREFSHWDGVEFLSAETRGARWRVRSHLRRLLRAGNAVIVHSHGFTAGIQAVLANLATNAPHVITLHDVVRRSEFPGFLGALKLRVLSALLSRATALVAVSEQARRNVQEHLPGLRASRTRLVTISNGIDVAQFEADSAPRPGILRQRLGLGPNVRIVGFLGRLMPQKGFLPLIHAIELIRGRQRAPAFRLVVVGSGDLEREYRAEVARRAAVAKCTTFLPRVARVADILPELDLLVVPSLWEACPLLPMEAMCAGVPVLGTDCIGLAEVLRGTPSMVVPAGDVGALATALEKALRALWTDAARKYACRARERFDVRPRAEELRLLFDQIRRSIGKPTGTAPLPGNSRCHRQDSGAL